jgi:hypothetical protein
MLIINIIMPVRRSMDSKGPYYAWGKLGERYHYKSCNEMSRKIAKGKAERQGRAIHANQNRK